MEYENNKEKLLAEIESLRQKIIRMEPPASGSVSKKRRSKSPLNLKEFQFEPLINEVPRIAVNSLAEDGTILLWDQECAEVFGLDSSQALGRRFQDIVLESTEAGEFTERLEFVWKSGKATPPKKWVVKGHNGKQRWLVSTIFPIMDQDKVFEAFSITVDMGEYQLLLEDLRNKRQDMETILQQKDQEINQVKGELERITSTGTDRMEEVKSSEVWLTSLMNSLPDIVYRLDQNGKLIFISEEICKYGYEPEELIGKNIFDLVHPEDRELAKYRVNERRTGERSTKTLEVRLFSKRNAAIPFEIKTRQVEDNPVFNISAEGMYDKGKPAAANFMGTLGVARDISERKHSEIEKKQLESQLRQSHKMEAIGTLASGIAHDFNNILSAIIGFTEIASFQLKDDNRAKYHLMKVLKAGDRAKGLVNQILSFTRRGEQKLSPVLLGPIIKESLKLMRATLPSTIEIRSHVDSGMVKGDPTQLHQIVMNICLNSAHAMQKSGGILEVVLNNVYLNPIEAKKMNISPGSYCRLSISDSGTGIPDDIKERIFEPYFTTKPKGEGTGLGLAVVHGIVHNHGGHIAIDSEIMKGTTVSIHLPQIKGEVEVEPEREDTLEGGKKRILFVDDEAMLVELGKEMLEILGYHAVTCSSPLDALNLFRQDPDGFDLIITDLTMPQMTGEMLAREINMVRSDIPILLVSGAEEIIDEKFAVKSGIKDRMLKPLHMGELSKKIRKLLES